MYAESIHHRCYLFESISGSLLTSRGVNGMEIGCHPGTEIHLGILDMHIGYKYSNIKFCTSSMRSYRYYDDHHTMVAWDLLMQNRGVLELVAAVTVGNCRHATHYTTNKVTVWCQAKYLLLPCHCGASRTRIARLEFYFFK